MLKLTTPMGMTDAYIYLHEDYIISLSVPPRGTGTLVGMTSGEVHYVNETAKQIIDLIYSQDDLIKYGLEPFNFIKEVKTTE